MSGIVQRASPNVGACRIWPRGLVFGGDAEHYRSFDWTGVSFNEQMSLITHAYVRGNRDDTISVISNHCVTFRFHVI